MMKSLGRLFGIFAIVISGSAAAQTAAELRGGWVADIENLDVTRDLRTDKDVRNSVDQTDLAADRVSAEMLQHPPHDALPNGDIACQTNDVFVVPACHRAASKVCFGSLNKFITHIVLPVWAE